MFKSSVNSEFTFVYVLKKSPSLHEESRKNWFYVWNYLNFICTAELSSLAFNQIVSNLQLSVLFVLSRKLQIEYTFVVYIIYLLASHEDVTIKYLTTECCHVQILETNNFSNLTQTKSSTETVQVSDTIHQFTRYSK